MTKTLHDPVMDNAVAKLEEVLDQFPRKEMAWVELGQNHRDSETPQIDYWSFLIPPGQISKRTIEKTTQLGISNACLQSRNPELYSVVIMSEDWGIGMTHEDRKEKFFNLYFSSKEGDTTKAGKFGIGGKSIFALWPDTYIVESTKNDEWWQVKFQQVKEEEELAFELKEHKYVMFLTENSKEAITIPKTRGTREIYVRHCATETEAEKIISAMHTEVTSRMCHVLVPIYIDGRCINRPFDIEDAIVKCSFSQAGLKGVIALKRPRHGVPTARYQIEEHGIAIEQGTNLINEICSVLLESPFFKHTIDRTKAQRDDYFEKAMQIVRMQEPRIAKAMFKRLEQLANITPEKLEAMYSDLTMRTEQANALREEYNFLMSMAREYVIKTKERTRAQYKLTHSFFPIREVHIDSKGEPVKLGYVWFKGSQQKSFKLLRKPSINRTLPKEIMQRKIFQTTERSVVSLEDVIKNSKKAKVIYVSEEENEVTQEFQKKGIFIIRDVYLQEQSRGEDLLAEFGTVKKSKESFRTYRELHEEFLSEKQKRFLRLAEEALDEYRLEGRFPKVRFESTAKESYGPVNLVSTLDYGSNFSMIALARDVAMPVNKFIAMLNAHDPTIQHLMKMAEVYDYAGTGLAKYFLASIITTTAEQCSIDGKSPVKTQEKLFKRFRELQNAKTKIPVQS